MPCCDVTAGHYYSQLITTAHASYHLPAAARFTEHGQLGIVTGYRPASSPTKHAPFCNVGMCLHCREIMTEKEFLDLTTSEERCVVHFYHTDFRRCSIMHTHLEVSSNSLRAIISFFCLEGTVTSAKVTGTPMLLSPHFIDLCEELLLSLQIYLPQTLAVILLARLLTH